MIYFKIYFTLIFVVLAIAGSSWSLMNSDTKRENLWFKLLYLVFCFILPY
jgi:hypothetical protein